ncbi:hypothetical protein GGI07_000875 [Coemansia sp. Benny D115]|nr:hypothetical protein GGI07_000875 [Coemansia sp. Benny D115]
MTRVLAGPYCTMLLGDLGADIIKIEHPQRGDDTRSWGPPYAAHSATTSVTIDMKTKKGQDILKELTKNVDVLVENYVPGKLAQYGLAYEDLKEINPRLIYASITGYGSTGPWREKPGYDVIIEAEAGLMHITGEADGQPVKVGVAVTDIMTGLYTHGAIMAALISRAKNGRGQHIDASLLQTQVAALANIGSNYLVGGQEARRWGTRHPSIAPYEVFPTRDGSICLGAGNDGQFVSLCKRLNRPELISEPRFRSNSDRVANRKELLEILNAEFSARTTKELLDLLEGSGLPFGPVNNIKQTFEHPQLVARGVVRQVDHPLVGTVSVVGPAVEYSGDTVDVRSPPPLLGQHTEEVLRQVIGYNDHQMAEAVKSGGAVLYDYGDI